MAKTTPRYTHTSIHNYSAAEQVVPFLLDNFDLKSVVDVGCGTGTWLKVFQQNGVQDIFGIDGTYVDTTTLHIDSHYFQHYDLETPYVGVKKFDMAISLEVAEHLIESSADTFIKSVTGLSDLILFSAAIPRQGGQNHLNEQPPLYWIKKFENAGFTAYDVVRPAFWENQQVEWWYRQNMILFSKNTDLSKKLSSMPSFFNAHLVHHQLLQLKEGELDSISRFRKPLAYYLELFQSALASKLKNKFSPKPR